MGFRASRLEFRIQGSGQALSSVIVQTEGLASAASTVVTMTATYYYNGSESTTIVAATASAICAVYFMVDLSFAAGILSRRRY